MPVEMRKIVFAPDELMRALYGFCLHIGKKMPSSGVTKLTIDAKPEAMATLHFDDSDAGKARIVELTREEVAAALIRYCREIGVPIPKGGRKSLAKDGDRMALTIAIGADPVGPKEEKKEEKEGGKEDTEDTEETVDKEE